MTYRSLHQLDSTNNTAFEPIAVNINTIVERALDPTYLIGRTGNNTGNTSFSEAHIEVAYIRGRGIGHASGKALGVARFGGFGIRKRLRNMGPHKMLELHLKMKVNNLQAPMETGHGGKYPLFYTFERLLELFYGPKKYKATVPPRLRNWVPADGSFWDHWWKDRG